MESSHGQSIRVEGPEGKSGHSLGETALPIPPYRAVLPSTLQTEPNAKVGHFRQESQFFVGLFENAEIPSCGNCVERHLTIGAVASSRPRIVQIPGRPHRRWTQWYGPRSGRRPRPDIFSYYREARRTPRTSADTFARSAGSTATSADGVAWCGDRTAWFGDSDARSAGTDNKFADTHARSATTTKHRGHIGRWSAACDRTSADRIA